VRPCLLGEGLRESGACYKCPAQTFLLKAPITATTCIPCDNLKSFCLGEDIIGPKPGYWRKATTTSTFLKCPKKEVCLGMDETASMEYKYTKDKRPCKKVGGTYPKECSRPIEDIPGNLVGRCDVELGFYGVMCSMCLPGYIAGEGPKCTKCQYDIELYKMLGIFFLMLGGLVMMVKGTIAGAVKENTHSVLVKILMNHLQMLIITAGFDMRWPKLVTDLFDVALPIKELTGSITAFDCWMDYRDPTKIDPYSFTTDPDFLPVIYQKMLVMTCLPIFIGAGAYCSWAVAYRCRRDRAYTPAEIAKDVEKKFVASYIIVIFLVHPSMTKALIDMYNCRTYDGVIRLSSSLQTVCWEGKHNLIAKGVALPCIFLWGLGIPAAVFMLMRKSKNTLDTPETKQKFGFLYNGYKRHNYFWEIIIMYRKIFCIMIAVFLQGQGIVL
jgi:hypothetical protein